MYVCVKKMTRQRKKEKKRWRKEKHKRKDFNTRAIRVSALANIKSRENDAIFVNNYNMPRYD